MHYQDSVNIFCGFCIVTGYYSCCHSN
jgi:hypothetical protein